METKLDTMTGVLDDPDWLSNPLCEQVMHVTTYQIAKKLGIAQATVSRALRQDPQIALATQQLVRETARNMGYQSNLIARSLSTGKTGLLGFVMGSLEIESEMRLAMAIELHALEHGYRVLSFYHQGQVANEVRDIYELKGMRVEGLIAYPVERIGGESYRQLAQSGFPMVLLGVDTPALGFEVSTVNVDFADSSRRAVAHLTALGRRQLAFIVGGTASWSVQARLKGWREGCALEGLHFEACPMASDTMDSSPEAGYRMAQALLTKNKPFDALLVSNDMMAIAAIKALHDARLRVPEDVAVIGFDDLRLSPFLSIPLTTFSQPTQAISALAIQTLMDQLAGQHASPISHLVAAPLVERVSTLGQAGYSR